MAELVGVKPSGSGTSPASINFSLALVIALSNTEQRRGQTTSRRCDYGLSVAGGPSPIV